MAERLSKFPMHIFPWIFFNIFWINWLYYKYAIHSTLNMSKCLFDVVQNSKLRFITCPEVFLFGLKFTESNSASEWALRSVDNYVMLELPETFEEVEKVALDKSYNFLMSMDTESINKEIARLGIEALMFWELPK